MRETVSAKEELAINGDSPALVDRICLYRVSACLGSVETRASAWASGDVMLSYVYGDVVGVKPSG